MAEATAMKVPMLDLKAQFETIRDEVFPAVREVLESQLCLNGPAVGEFERQMAEYCGTLHAVGVSSGTDALLATLMSLNVGAGDEVVTTPFTFFATAGSIWRTGARPVFVDIQADTFNIDPSGVAAAVTGRTKAIMPVHLFGQVADMDPILALAAKRGLYVVEDAAQAVGATCKGRKAGSLGTAGCLSFYPTKNLGCNGDGGMVVTDDEELDARLRQARNHGQTGVYRHGWVGGNFRLDTIQAAALIVKLRHLEDWSAKRRANAALYDTLLADCGEVATPVVREGNVSIYNQYVVRVPRRDELQAHLRDAGIGSAVYYPLSLHEQECFRELGYKRGQFPQSEAAADEVLALPIFPELADEQIEYVAARVKEFFA
jgi:dTDP-4-amino-4,6-dideoxygalactose transaminase